MNLDEEIQARLDETGGDFTFYEEIGIDWREEFKRGRMVLVTWGIESLLAEPSDTLKEVMDVAEDLWEE